MTDAKLAKKMKQIITHSVFNTQKFGQLAYFLYFCLHNSFVFKISYLAIANLQRKFDKLLFSYLFIRVGNFS
ncbi:hypothetical protein T230_05005 [Tannerella sp. oral taxon BU063 isolate Cell 1/3]|uniref:Uncharacterized protein n=2 Tax=Tannerella serpentiformis TaxID=712710 RepID=W2CSF4_9BACT|nr:hypothetical protein T230_05005 [Tannerella sp. oral taxon BU063 isolate Cell 1/3]ETK12585.1 hypothetical protein T235_08420 [Tannerella sp. oral taxon BU063 isolate Cell 8/11]